MATTTGEADAGARQDAGTEAVRIPREAFNTLAAELNLPWFWLEDKNRDGTIDPPEVRTLLFHGPTAALVEGGRFNATWDEGYRRIVSLREKRASDRGLAGLDARQKLVIADLESAPPALVHTETTGWSDEDKRFARAMLDVAEKVDALYAAQLGLGAFAEQVADDPASRALYRRNWGPGCATKKLRDNPACTAVDSVTKRTLGVYPTALQADAAFCDKLAAHRDKKSLLGHFTVVREQVVRSTTDYVAVPYSVAFGPKVRDAASALRKAAVTLESPSERSLRTYLEAAARAFENDDWEAADAAWVAMDVTNSKWYVRVGPDETYWDPCKSKAGYHAVLARIHPKSAGLKATLGTLRDTMEREFRPLSDGRYTPRPVKFDPPALIEVVWNAGDSRAPIGATAGQSLPNWGSIASQGRGRTVVMTNIGRDAEGLRSKRAAFESLATTALMQHYTDDAEPALLGVTLHEIAHNLGPTHEYRYRGALRDSDVFGNEGASMLEELKAQTAALYFVELLQSKGIVSERLAQQIYVAEIAWALAHIGQGTAGEYSALARIQLGFLLEEGVLRFDADAVAANGVDRGSFRLEMDRLREGIAKLMRRVTSIKVRGDRKGLEALVTKYGQSARLPTKVIEERQQRQPKSHLVYSIDF